MAANLYSQWRARLRPAGLREGAGAATPERLLQAVWFHQRLKRDALRLADGRALRVLHPGFWNREAGPDFLGAMIQIETDTPLTGDVEVDLEPAGWRGHGHDCNRSFDNVILHVVWEGIGAANLPRLELRQSLDAPLDELEAWLGDTGGDWPPELRGRCSAPMRELPERALGELLRQAALVRLQGKAAAFTARARAAGWEQALWEGVFAALGYKHNVWPFRRLAELLPSLRATAATTAPLDWQARLFGVAGLLPHEFRGRSADSYLGQLWHLWWRERDAHAEAILPAELWRFHGLRPANHPLRRLALAAHWLARTDFAGQIAAWLEADESLAGKPATLLARLQAGADEFWSRHYTLAAPATPKPMPLLGATRATDLAINVLLPWLFARAVAGGAATFRARVEAVYLGWPAAEDNAVLKLARQRLLGGRARLPPGAAPQQGLLQIVRDFCERSNSLCEQCSFPDLVRQFGGS